MVEDQQAFFVIQDRVVMCKALVVAHIIERLQHRDAGFQNAFGHDGLKMASLA
ncbi:hypothetical protein D3C85_1397310 [compost metagenome]